MALEHTYTRTVTISTGASGISGVADVSDGLPVGLIVSSTWTAADITFQASPIGSSVFHPLTDFSGAVVESTAVVAGQWQNLDPDVFAGIDRMKVVSGSSQAAARVVTLVCLVRSGLGR